MSARGKSFVYGWEYSEVSSLPLTAGSSTHNYSGYDAIIVPKGLLVKGCHESLAQLLTPTTMAQTKVKMVVMTEAPRFKFPQR